MDDNDVCPLCCEDLDISDRKFFPCKCGYQICMWCWHRIRETESGLCPACRTPYGDDPHAFSAVDVEEVLKANKEKAAAEKRAREAQKAAAAAAQSEAHNSMVDGDASHASSMSGGGSIMGLGSVTGPMALPKDRTQLANMRVIRRNLVYAVGLPPSLTNEEQLRKAEYFGQYGKISKIVVNRSNAAGGDPRRASTSAYVTFVHKEDTLACILALDGFFVDGRNIRASYGTSKYCSAFIKSVRCNNPECTYLHSMGEAEDTFTKQEIQAGYVTSGRDVLARQQQIVAQALADGRTAGARRKVGGGGPSGTGRHSSSPVFPAPTYDEPPRISSTPLVPPPPPANHSRALSTGAGFSAVAAAAAAGTSSGKIQRASSLTSQTSPPPPSGGGLVGGLTSLSKAPASRKGSIGSIGSGLSNASTVVAGNGSSSTISGSVIGAPAGATAASVVAGVHSLGATPAAPPAPHTTLTPLTPLKRTSQTKVGVPKATSLEALGGSSLSTLRNGSVQKPSSLTAGAIGTAPTSPSSSIGSGSIGGTVISVGFGRNGNGMGTLNSSPTDGTASVSVFGSVIGGSEPKLRPSVLGGEIVTGDRSTKSDGVIGGTNTDKWSVAGIGGDPVVNPSTSNIVGGGSLWQTNGTGSAALSSDGLSRRQNSLGPSDGIGGARIGGGASSSAVGGGVPLNSGSSALASMLGINLPSGSGSLRESSTLWEGGNRASIRTPVASLGGQSLNSVGPGLIGGAPIGGSTIGSSRCGAMPIGSSANPKATVGGDRSNSKSDIALLHSLLPGVHITSGNAQQPAAVGSVSYGGFGSIGGNTTGNPGWNGNPTPGPIGSNSRGSWNGAHGRPTPVGAPTSAAPIGGIIGGRGAPKQQQQQSPSIW